MNPKYFEGTAVRYISPLNDHITGAQVTGIRQTPAGKFRYWLTHNSGRIEDDGVPEDELVVDLAVGDFVERWSLPGQVGVVVEFDKGQPVIAWENSSCPPNVVDASALRTCKPTHKMGDHVNTKLGLGEVVAVRNLQVTVKVVVDGRKL